MVLCVATLPETARVAKTLWLVGCVLASIVYGILLTLAYSCVQALRRRKHGSSYVNRGLIAYVLLVTVTATATEIFAIQGTLYGVLDVTCVGPYLHVFQPYFGPSNIITFLIALLTDGLLVWRCYMVTSGVRGSRFLWLTPLFSYVVMIGLSIALTVGLFVPPERQGSFAFLFPLQLGTSVLINTLITSIIVALLFRHRRMMIRSVGGEQQLPLLNIMTILIESAALIVFMDIAVIITVERFNSVGDLVTQSWNFVQTFASLLIIDRVSRDSDYFSQKKREEAESMSTLNVIHSLPSQLGP